MLERLPDLPASRHHVAVMHYWPFMEQLDEPAWDLTRPDEYDNWYFSIDPPHRQRLWERWPDAERRHGFHSCLVSDSGIDVTFVPGDDQCEEFGSFGPIGHPPIAERDYSAATEKPPLVPEP